MKEITKKSFVNVGGMTREGKEEVLQLLYTLGYKWALNGIDIEDWMFTRSTRSYFIYPEDMCITYSCSKSDTEGVQEITLEQLKEMVKMTEVIKPEDTTTIELSYAELFELYTILGKGNSFPFLRKGFSLWTKIAMDFDFSSDVYDEMDCEELTNIEALNNPDNQKVYQELFNKLFNPNMKSEKELQAEELETKAKEMLEQATKLRQSLKGE